MTEFTIWKHVSSADRTCVAIIARPKQPSEYLSPYGQRLAVVEAEDATEAFEKYERGQLKADLL